MFDFFGYRCENRFYCNTPSLTAWCILSCIKNRPSVQEKTNVWFISSRMLIGWLEIDLFDNDWENGVFSSRHPLAAEYLSRWKQSDILLMQFVCVRCRIEEEYVWGGEDHQIDRSASLSKNKKDRDRKAQTTNAKRRSSNILLYTRMNKNQQQPRNEVHKQTKRERTNRSNTS